MSECTGDEARSTAEAVARRSYGKLVAFIAARSHDLAAAEDALSEAFASALQSWPQNGCPANPEAWLLTVARRKLIDMARRQHGSALVDEDLERVAQGGTPGDEEIADRRLVTPPRAATSSKPQTHCPIIAAMAGSPNTSLTG
jgi:RNA polymerase sigma-70 factor (ECF subfamily)